jgi:hypothetical protein
MMASYSLLVLRKLYQRNRLEGLPQAAGHRRERKTRRQWVIGEM